MAFAYPSGFNTFVPSFEASGHLVVAFSRNPKDFPLNKWISLTPVKKSVGYYLRITPEVAARVINNDLREFIWTDGDDAPDGNWGTESFSWFPFNTTRYSFPFRLGYKAEEQADWKILSAHSEFAAQDAMTARAVRCINKLLDSAQYASSHVKTATVWGGGFWSAGTSTSPIIKKSLNAMAQQIQLDTLGKVKPSDLNLVISPLTADIMARSAEIHDYAKGSYVVQRVLEDGAVNPNQQWGLPPSLYGFPIVVDDTVQVTTKKGATTTTAYAFGPAATGTAALVCRKSGLTSVAGGPSFSTIHVFSYEEMTVEQRDDPDNRRIKARVVEDYDVQVVAPATACLATNVYA